MDGEGSWLGDSQLLLVGNGEYGCEEVVFCDIVWSLPSLMEFMVEYETVVANVYKKSQRRLSR